MLRKLQSLIVCVALLASTLCVDFSVLAVSEDADGIQISDTNIAAEAEDDVEEYAAYYNTQISDAARPSDKITLAGTDYQHLTGAAQKAKDELAGDVLKIAQKNDTVTWDFTVPEAAAYRLEMNYKPLEGKDNDLNLSFMLDGSYPYDEAKSVSFPRLWKDAGDVRVDVNGNQSAPDQEECFVWSTRPATDKAGFVDDALMVYLTAGEHTLTLESVNEEPFLLKEVLLLPGDEVLPYDEAVEKYPTDTVYTGKEISIEGEAADIKTTSSLVPKADNSSASLSPSSDSLDILNYIGSSNWSNPGETLTWKIHVEESGLYKLGFRFRQSYKINSFSYRRLEIDGKVPFKEASRIGFTYGTNWMFDTFADSEGTPYLFYLSKGEHEISLSVTLGAYADICRELQEQVYALGRAYRSMVMVMGTTPDANRDYNLFGQAKGLREDLEESKKVLERLIKTIQDLTGKRSDSLNVVLQNTVGVIERLLDDPYYAQKYMSDFYSNYCSLGASLYELQKMPLDLDEIIFAAPEKEFEKTLAGFFEQLTFSVKRFISSFIYDYNNMSAAAGETQESITLWLYWGRDQVQIANTLIQERFVSEYGINVNVKVVNASLIQAMLSGDCPDVSLRLSRTDPVNLAMRGALHDLSTFDDYEEVLERFQPTASVPYRFGDGLYALPDTQQFFMMFYRKDIFEEYGLTVPKTWQEFIDVSAFFSHNNLQVGLPYTSISDLSVPNSGVGALNLFATLLLQNGGELYNKEQTAAQLDSQTAVESFTYWTQFYSEYGFPKTFDFYNRFRSGEMPLAIVPYTQYNTLSVAATEISGLWGMAPIPGVEKDGVINNASAGGGTGSVILKQSQHKDAAWTFLKWWTSAETQVAYSKGIETVLGAAERQATANMEALQQLSWSDDDLKALVDQWEKVIELPELPGGYLMSRAVDQAFWSVVTAGHAPRSTILSWSDTVNEEIARKRNEYGLN